MQLLTKKRDIKRGCLVGQLAHDKQIMNQPELASKVTYTFKWIQNEIEQLLTIGIREGSISNIFSPFEGSIFIMSLLQGRMLYQRDCKIKITST
jgi:TetR/AcrR family transcriptional regulator, transcriptional repressor for nem operon